MTRPKCAELFCEKPVVATFDWNGVTSYACEDYAAFIRRTIDAMGTNLNLRMLPNVDHAAAAVVEASSTANRLHVNETSLPLPRPDIEQELAKLRERGAIAVDKLEQLQARLGDEVRAMGNNDLKRISQRIGALVESASPLESKIGFFAALGFDMIVVADVKRRIELVDGAKR